MDKNFHKYLQRRCHTGDIDMTINDYN